MELPAWLPFRNWPYLGATMMAMSSLPTLALQAASGARMSSRAPPPSQTMAGWQPIGKASYHFSALFEGNIYVIANRYINRSTQGNVGLFSRVGAASIICNVGLGEVNVSGYSGMGGLVVSFSFMVPKERCQFRSSLIGSLTRCFSLHEAIIVNLKVFSARQNSPCLPLLIISPY